MTVRTIKLLMADRVRPQHFPARGQLEYSTDGQTWTPVCGETSQATILLDLGQNAITARMLRYRVIEPTVKRRLGVCEFTVNKPLPARLSNSIPGFKNISAYNDEKHIAMVRIMETAKAAPGQGFGITFPTPVTGVGLSVDLDNEQLTDWAEIVFTLADGSTEKARLQQYYGAEFIVEKEDMPKKTITAIHLTNTSNQEQDLRLNAFQLSIPKVDSAAMASSLTDCDFSTAYDTGAYSLNTEINVPAGARTLIIVGSARCQVSGASYAGGSGLIQTFKLHAGTGSVRIHANRQYGTKMYEAIFR